MGWSLGSWLDSGRVLRAHPVAAVLLAAGLVLRVLAVMAYHPALLYVDTLKYLYGAWPGADPVGYTAILKPILLVGDLGTVALVQHRSGPGDGGGDLRAAGAPGCPPLARRGRDGADPA